ncbi:hypothetical protein MTP99_010861 [Tenebrio molitor]|nr:hypothetical protein MTP99_010861 [Tenebrio molitor]
MKPENMNVTPSNEFESITPDVNLMSDEFNFSPISEEARESGDGDSGAESKENLEFDKTRNNNYQVIKDSQTDITADSRGTADSRDSKKLKDKRISKIPIRQVKLPFVPRKSGCHSSQMQHCEGTEFSTYENLVIAPATDESGVIDHKNVNMESGDFNDNLDNTSWDLKQVQSCGSGDGDVASPSKEVSHCNRLPILGGFTFNQPNDENVNGIQTGLNPDCKGDSVESRLIEQSSTDLVDIFSDLSAIHNGDDGVVNMSSLTSLSPRAPLASDDLDVPIIEAPEEFRCPGEEVGGCGGQVDIGEPEERHTGSSYRDYDNACKAETGDTTRRATEKDEGEHGSAGGRQIRITEVEKSTSLRDQCYGDDTPGDNDHVLPGCDHNNAIVTEGHVGSTAPVQVNSDTPRTYAGVDGANRSQVPPVLDNEMNEPLGGADERSQSCIIKGAKVNSVGPSNGGTVGTTSEEQCAGEGEAVNVPGSSEASCDACVCLCADQPQSETTTGPSIEIGVAKCAQASGCSRVSTAKVCVALDPGHLNSICGDSRKTRDKPNTIGTVGTPSPDPSLSKHHPNVETVDESETTSQTCNKSNGVNSPVSKHLSWTFKNGRLVFDVAGDSENESTVAAEINSEGANGNRKESAEVGKKGENDSDEQSDNSQDNDEINKVLYSKDLNKRIDEKRSRLKYLEQKLKKAGITDDESLEETEKNKHVDADQHKCKNSKTIEQVVDKSSTTQDNKEPDYDTNQNILKNQNSISATRSILDSANDGEIIPEGTDTVDFTGGDFCEFDVRQVDTFSGFNGCWEVYDELDDDSDCDEEQFHIITRARIRANIANMGIDGERAKHNPDRDNLKSLLKRPGKSKDKRSNRVVFNENKNEFFDADYIILIREECDYDEEDDDGVCTCNQHEMVRLTCCEPNCNCNVYDGFEQTPQSPKFAPPLEFVDAVTLSPPEGYKDMELEEQQLLALQQIARRGQRTAVCRECSVTHDDVEDDGEFILTL